MRRALGGCVAVCALLVGSPEARATHALAGAKAATELRVAYAETGQWTTVWASFRLDGAAGPVGVVVPLPEGAFVDQSTDAWFEALEVATAPRVRPPDGLSPFCPGTTGAPDPFEITASTAHAESLLPQSMALVDGAAGILGWAAAEGLALDAALADKLASTGAVKLLGMRFEAPAGEVVTPTLRVTAPAGLPVLPFSITRAGAADVRVTAWLFGPGRASFTGTTAAAVPGNALVWDAKSGTSNYVEYRDELLSGDPDRDLLESAGHDALADGDASGPVTLEGLAPVYFSRASTYGNALPGAGACIDAAKTALGSDLVVGPVCPRGDLAALAGACPPGAPGAGELDGAALFCGPGADDLALAAAGEVPSELWVTRHVFVIPAGGAGNDRGVFEGSGAEKVPVLSAASVDIGGCFGGEGGGSTTSSSGSGAGTPTGTTTSSSSSSSGSGGTSTGTGTRPPGTQNPGGFGGYPDDPGSDVYIDTSGCSCSPGVVDTYDDGASGDDCDSGSSSGDDCDSGSSSGGDDCDSGSSSGGDDCDSGSSSGGDDCDSGSGAGEDCDSGSGSGDSCSSDAGSSDCSVSRPKARGHRRGPKLSALMLLGAGLLFPLRRRGRKQRRQAA